MNQTAVGALPPLAIAAIGAVLVGLIYQADARIGGVLIFLVVVSLLSYAYASGNLKGSS